MENITEGNKLIAEFMRLKIEGYPDKSDSWLVDRNNLKSIYHNVPEQEIAFDTSWEWLMPVVEKIGVITQQEMIGEDLDIYTATIFSEIGFVYECVLQFIQWYNTLNL